MNEVNNYNVGSVVQIVTLKSSDQAIYADGTLYDIESQSDDGFRLDFLTTLLPIKSIEFYLETVRKPRGLDNVGFINRTFPENFDDVSKQYTIKKL